MSVARETGSGVRTHCVTEKNTQQKMMDGPQMKTLFEEGEEQDRCMMFILLNYCDGVVDIIQ